MNVDGLATLAHTPSRLNRAGIIVSGAGTLPWSFFVTWNQRVLLKIPWAIGPMGIYLFLFWRYLNGRGWPQSTSEARKNTLRANNLSGDTWMWSIVAGMIGLATLFPLLRTLGRLVNLPSDSQPINVPPQMPFTTVVVLLVMASLVAGIVEEAAFRGYVQGPLERQYGFLTAILVNGTLFGLAHFTHHPKSVIAMLPYYLAVTAIYGGLAYATNSILPGLALHAGGDVLSLTRLWMTGQAEWQVTTTAMPPPLIWSTGVDASFILSTTVFIVLGSITLRAYWALARAAKGEMNSGRPA